MSSRSALALLFCFALPLAAPAEAPEIDAIPLGPSPEQRLAEVRRRVQAAVTYPARARELGLEGVARIQFEIGADGHAQDVATIESSGHALLDHAAERGAVEAGELPRVFGRIRIPVRFDLRGVEEAYDGAE